MNVQILPDIDVLVTISYKRKVMNVQILQDIDVLVTISYHER